VLGPPIVYFWELRESLDGALTVLFYIIIMKAMSEFAETCKKNFSSPFRLCCLWFCRDVVSVACAQGAPAPPVQLNNSSQHTNLLR
jgi:predicted DNA-binding ribbon-helix-helix protein